MDKNNCFECCKCCENAKYAAKIGNEYFAFCGEECVNNLWGDYQKFGVNVTSGLRRLVRRKGSSSSSSANEFIKYNENIHRLYTIDYGYKDDFKISVNQYADRLQVEILSDNNQVFYQDRERKNKGYETKIGKYSLLNRSINNLGFVVSADYQDTPSSEIDIRLKKKRTYFLSKEKPSFLYLSESRKGPLELTIYVNITGWGSSISGKLKLSGNLNNDLGKYLLMKGYKEHDFIILELSLNEDKSTNTKKYLEISLLNIFIPNTFQSKLMYKESIPK
jgi:hypothetical protein